MDRKSFFKILIRSFFIQCLWNFERLQNIGFLFVIKPFLDKLYKDREERKNALLRHIDFFNAHPYTANIIAAIVANDEKKVFDEGKKTNLEHIATLKNSLAGPIAAVGDAFFWGTVRPVIAYICIFFVIAFTGSRSEILGFNFDILIPVFFILIYNLVHIFSRVALLYCGFKYDRKCISIISGSNFKCIWDFIKLFGFLVVLFNLVVYLYCFGFNVYGFSNGKIPDALIYGAVFICSVFATGKWVATFLFYLIVLLCITISYLGV
jgi:PTS system mannose-specific IID component